MRRHPLLLLGLLAVLGAPPLPVAADVSTEARTPAEVYERHRNLADTLAYVVEDLKTRYEGEPTAGAASLMLVVDPHPALRDEIEALAQALPAAAAAGPPGLRVGALGAGGDVDPPHADVESARGALLALAFLPDGGRKNLLAAVREAVRALKRERGPASILLLADPGAEAEDDVERVRDDLIDAGVAFYAIAPEAALEVPWLQTFKARNDPATGLTERFHPEPQRGERDTLFYGCDVAVGLLPYTWELDLVRTRFTWVRPPRYPVPSGFGYWSLATLAYSTGGRYFVYDFSRPPAHPSRRGPPDRRTMLYDFSRLAMFAPDLRPRSRILKDLSRNPRTKAIVRIWEHLGDEACPVVGVLGNVELVGGALSLRPARPVRSSDRPRVWYEEMEHVRDAKDFARRRLDRIEHALRLWASANAKPRERDPRTEALEERLEADFQLLGTFLRQVRFHWLERLAALRTIKPLHVSHRRVRLVPKVIARGFERAPEARDLGDRERNVAFAELWLTRKRLRAVYRNTPWALLLERQPLFTYDTDVRVIEPAKTRPGRPPKDDDTGGKGGKGKKPAKPKPRPRPAPPPRGPRPGSTTGGPATGGD